MVEKEIGRSGEYINESGQSEFWWEGRNYGCILPDQIIDAELAASKYSIENGGNDYGLQKRIR